MFSFQIFYASRKTSKVKSLDSRWIPWPCELVLVYVWNGRLLLGPQSLIPSSCINFKRPRINLSLLMDGAIGTPQPPEQQGPEVIALYLIGGFSTFYPHEWKRFKTLMQLFGFRCFRGTVQKWLMKTLFKMAKEMLFLRLYITEA